MAETQKPEVALPFEVERVQKEAENTVEENSSDAHLGLGFGECGAFDEVDVDEHVIHPG